MNSSQRIHGTCLQIRGVGCLIRGKSGAGKSLLALALLDRAKSDCALISDDLTEVSNNNGKLEASCPQSKFRGSIELWGRGIVTRRFIERAELHLIIDMIVPVERMPDESQFSTTLLSVQVARCPVPTIAQTNTYHQCILVDESLREIAAGLNFQ